jgi:integrase
VTVPKQESKEKEIYTIAEMEQIFEKLETEPLKYRMFIMLAVYSGCRRSELLGFEWKDVNFDDSLIQVKRTSNYSPKRGMYTDTTKTKKSQRILKFPPIIMDMLKEHKEKQDYERERMGSKWIDSDRLFVQWDGRPLHNNTPYTWFLRFCERSGFRFCDLHSMRHFHASVLINAGVDVASVSGDLGHATVGTTMNIYCHVFQEARVKNCEAITAALDFKKTKSDRISDRGEDGEENNERVAV